MQVLPGTDSQSIAVLTSPSQSSLAPLMSMVVGT